MRFTAPQSGHPTDDPVLLALTDTQRRFKIPGRTARPVGLWHRHGYPGRCRSRFDLRQTNPGASTAPSAICVSIAIAWPRWSAWFASAIFGYSDPAAEALAENLGLAFQLTNIIRDIKEDAGMGRIYLPAEDLARFKIAPCGDFARRRFRSGLRWLLAAEADGPANITAPPASSCC